MASSASIELAKQVLMIFGIILAVGMACGVLARALTILIVALDGLPMGTAAPQAKLIACVTSSPS